MDIVCQLPDFATDVYNTKVGSANNQCSTLRFAPLLERATHEELTELLFTWLKQKLSTETRWPVPLETIARIVSWAIFGAAIQWSQEETTMSKEQMANAILLVIMEGTARLSPDALPE
jgi:hypothetical protein